ncbi:MAG TPA: hypothetical protein ENN20_06765, partial [Candidatus Marinimicrobia bacterium]|nr:hypothetical protein [Candidatus Neomarinimicrobiota bacterium]
MKKNLLSIFIIFMITIFSRNILCQEHDRFFWINQDDQFDNYECEDLESDCMWFCLRWTHYFADTEDEKIYIKTVPANMHPWKLNSIDEETGAAQAAVNAW